MGTYSTSAALAAVWHLFARALKQSLVRAGNRGWLAPERVTRLIHLFSLQGE